MGFWEATKNSDRERPEKIDPDSEKQSISLQRAPF
jgi:hypothetical protein